MDPRGTKEVGAQEEAPRIFTSTNISFCPMIIYASHTLDGSSIPQPVWYPLKYEPICDVIKQGLNLESRLLVQTNGAVG